MAASDHIIYCNTNTNAISLTLPAPTNGRLLKIKDITGNAAVKNITILPHASEKIDGASSLIISDNYGSAMLSSDGTNWFIVTQQVEAGTVTTQTPNNSNAAGVSEYYSRADHTHNIPTGTPSGLSAITTNAQGSAAYFAQGDHTHAIASGAATVISGNANALGSSSSFALSDHQHQLTAGSASAQQAVQFDGTNWQAIYPEALLQRSNATEIFEDFIAGKTPTSGGLGSNSWQLNTNGGGAPSGATVATTSAGRPGILQLTSGNGGGGYSDISLSSVGCMILSGGQINYEANVILPTLSNSTNEYSFRIGFGDTIGADQANGIYFEYTQATNVNWLCKTAKASTRTTTTTTTAVTTEWTKLNMIMNSAGTSVGFYIDGTLVATITTNLPTSATRPFLHVTRALGTGGTAQCDYIWIYQRFSTAR